MKKLNAEDVMKAMEMDIIVNEFIIKFGETPALLELERHTARLLRATWKEVFGPVTRG